MKSAIKTYSIVIAVLFVIFNLIAFLAPGWIGADKYTAQFWIGYISITVAFVINYVITLIALKNSENKQKLFYNIPIVYICYCSLIVCIIVGALCMLNSNMPSWLAIVVSVIAIGINVISVLKAKIAIDVIETIDTQVKEKTSFIRDLTAQAKALTLSAKSPEAKDACNKVYEALRYSDPVSSYAVSDLEKEIMQTFTEFSDAVKANDFSVVDSCSNDLVALISQRNVTCKVEKR